MKCSHKQTHPVLLRFKTINNHFTKSQLRHQLSTGASAYKIAFLLQIQFEF